MKSRICIALACLVFAGGIAQAAAPEAPGILERLEITAQWENWTSGANKAVDLVIDEDTTWSGTVEVTNVEVIDGAVLTITPGTEIVFVTDLGSIIARNGVIFADAGAGAPITLDHLPTVEPYMGFAAFNDPDVFSAVYARNCQMANGVIGIATVGTNSFASAVECVFTNTMVATYYTNSYGNAVDCTALNGHFSISGGSASGCSTEGTQGFYVNGGSLTDCTATGAGLGFEGYGNFHNLLAEDCGLGYRIQAEYYVRPATVDLLSARNCDVGYWLYGGFVAKRLRASGSTTNAVRVTVYDGMYNPGVPTQLYIRDSKFTNTTGGAAIWVQRWDDTDAMVHVENTYFENNFVQVEVISDNGTLCPAELGRDGLYGDNKLRRGPLSTLDINNLSSHVLYAEMCDWGQPSGFAPNPVRVGLVDFTPWIGDPYDPPFPDDPVIGIKAKPNPFNPQTTISFSLARAGNVQLHVYDVTGRKVKTLINGQVEAGERSVVWDGTDTSGRRMATGMYFARVAHPEGHAVQKLMLVK